MEKIENMDIQKVLGIISRLDVFNQFSEEEMKKIVEFHSSCFFYDKDEYIIEEGNRTTSFFILLSGTVQITKNACSFPITRLEAGEFFGEMAFLANTPRSSNVIAEDKVIVIRVDKSMLEKLSPEIREKIKDKIIEKLVNRLIQMNNEFISLF